MVEVTPNPDQLAKQISAMGSARKRGSGPHRELVCGDIDIRIARDGTWFYHGSPIGRKRLVKLFATVLKREPDGSYVLETPVEKGRIQVDDVPFVAVELTVEGEGESQCLTLRTNIDESVTVDGDHPIRVRDDPETGHPVPYVLVRDALEARIARPVYYELVALGLERDVGSDHLYGVWSSGIFFSLGQLPAEPAGQTVARSTPEPA
ncbi:MAG TPA: DUF1285 domain-containing protein [Alphaproteobacteria bacterium]|nr:DUF1285 domain-containing protein [Alphaproteobacteria bacterium]